MSKVMAKVFKAGYGGRTFFGEFSAWWPNGATKFEDGLKLFHNGIANAKSL